MRVLGRAYVIVGKGLMQFGIIELGEHGTTVSHEMTSSIFMRADTQ